MIDLSKHLRRRTTSGNWIPEIDGLRFVAIMAVLLFHMQGQLAHHGAHPVQARYSSLAAVLNTGERGVQLFFVLSAYVLGRPFASHFLLGRKRPSLRIYFLRRLTRLEPPYILNLLVCAASFLLLSHVPWRTVLAHLASSIVYLHWLVFGDAYTTLNSVAWSLEVEVQFYVLAPLLTTVFLIHTRWLRRLMLVAVMLLSAAAQQRWHLGPLTLAGQLQYFLGGLLLVDLALNEMQHWPHHAGWDAVSVAGWLLVFTPGLPYLRFWLALLVVVLYVAAFRGRLVYRLLRLEWVALLGGMCYTIYLWHPLILSGVQRGLDRAAPLLPTDYGLYFLVQAVPKLLAVALGSMVLFALVERPCMNPAWPRLLLQALRTRSTSTHPAPHAAE